VREETAALRNFYLAYVGSGSISTELAHFRRCPKTGRKFKDFDSDAVRQKETFD
jgi:hypothetical protein